MNAIVQQFLTSNIANQCVQTLTKEQGINTQDAKRVVDATAEGAAQAVGKGGFDLGQMLKSLGGMAGALGGTQPQGLPPTIVKTVTDYVVNKTGMSATIVSAAVSMILPKILEFAKGQASPV